MTARDNPPRAVSRDVLARVPPHAEDAEKAVLGAILVDDRCLPLVTSVIGPAEFYVEAHRAIFEAMLALLQPLGILEVVRTGTIAMARGRG